jgi:nuclear pore complex protein Nup188
VTLQDGVVLRVETLDKDFVYAISDKFQIDEIQAFILLRSFLYNEGSPPQTGSNVVEELVEAITPFYFSERLFILRVLIPLFRAKENPTDPVHDIATDILPEMLPDGRTFAESVTTEYLRKTEERIPKNITGDLRSASRWAKQNYKEQLVMLEVLFWTMWGYVSCDGPIVARIFEAAYQTSFGSIQHNSNMLLDEEAHQLQQDNGALWLLVTIEVLELERIGEAGGLDISANSSDNAFYTSSPESLKKIHALVTSNRGSQFACTYLAWAFVISRLVEAAKGLREIPDGYREFFDTVLPNQRHSSSYSTDREPAHVIMSRTVLDPQAGLFRLMMMLLTSTPLFVTAIAWKTGSAVTDPNAIAFRSVLKGCRNLLHLIPY